MPGIRRLLSCIGQAVLEKGPRALLGIVPFGEAIFDVAAEALAKIRKHPEQEIRSELAEVAKTDAVAVRKEAEAVVAEVAGNQPKEVQLGLVSYLSLVPDAVRQSLRRPSDPTGTTVPSAMVLNRPEHLLPLLPSRLPRFKPGERPTPGGKWELTELLGVGGFGEVWKARHPVLKGIPPVALKFCLDPKAVENLKHESAVLDRIMQQGNNPGIVPLKQAQLDADPCYLEYEYIDGGNLSAFIARCPVPPAEAAAWSGRLMKYLAQTVGAFHRLTPPIVHRDLKPANILIQRVSTGGKTGFLPRVADFGIGGHAATQALEQTRAGSTTRGDLALTSLRGSHTPLYASPQQARGDLPDVRDDVHALGVIWFQLLTGQMDQGVGPDYQGNRITQPL